MRVSYNKFLERQLSALIADSLARQTKLGNNSLSARRSNRELSRSLALKSLITLLLRAHPDPRVWVSLRGVSSGARGVGCTAPQPRSADSHSAQHDHSRRANNYAKIRAKPSKKARPRARRLRPLPCSLTTSPEARTVFTFRTLRPHQPTYFSNHVKSRTVSIQYR
jgi:hypothetical protein